MEGASADTRARRNWQSARPFCGMVLAAGLLCALIACTEMNGLGMRAGLRSQAKQPKAANRSECFQLLLVVIFNQPHFYRNIPFLKKLYGNTFKHMVVYGAPPVPAGVHKTADISGGYFQQNTLIAAMTDYPKFDGYLFIGDDVWLNYPQLLSTMDLNKIWLNPDNETNFVEPSKFVKTDWVNWVKGFGLPEVRKTLRQGAEKVLQPIKGSIRPRQNGDQILFGCCLHPQALFHGFHCGGRTLSGRHFRDCNPDNTSPDLQQHGCPVFQ